MRLPSLLILLLACSPLRAALPELGALEALGSSALLAVEPQGARLLMVETDSLENARPPFQPILGPGGGAGAPEDAAEADARLALQILVLDTGRRALLQYNREWSLLGREALPERDFPPRPDLLAVSEGRTLVVADTRAGQVVARRPGEEWSVLLDFARVGRLRLTALEVVGEKVFLLEGGSRLWLCGSEGGWWESREDSTLRALHRAPQGGLWLLREKAGCWELEWWPAAARLSSLPDGESRLVARYPIPAASPPPRDFLPLPAAPGSVLPRLLLSRSGAPALILNPQEGPSAQSAP